MTFKNEKISRFDKCLWNHVKPGVGDINDKKKIMLRSHRCVTPTHNEYAALVKNNNTDDDDDVYTPVSVLKQGENNTSFDNSNASKVGVDNNDALAKKVYKINPKDTYISINNNSINTIDRSKEVVGTIDIVDTLGTGNNLF